MSVVNVSTRGSLGKIIALMLIFIFLSAESVSINLRLTGFQLLKFFERKKIKTLILSLKVRLR